MPVNYLRYWKGLIRRGLAGAAAGVLDDLFLSLAIFDGELAADANQFLTETRNERRRVYLEQAMEILDDSNGTELRTWIKLYQNDYSAFQTLAREWADDACVMAEEDDLNKPLE